MAYTKLDCGITESTIWQAPDTTRLVWITMLARADQNGYVGASMPGLAGLARVSLDACIAAINTLESPDTWSRTKEHDGRRIAPADGGWVLLNHSKYRAMQSADDRRERSRIAMAVLRNKRKQQATVNLSEQSYTKLAQAEAEAEAIQPPTPLRGSGRVREFPPGFENLWSAYRRKVAKSQAAKAYARLKPDDALQTQILAALQKQNASPQWLKDAGQFIPHLATWLNARRWEDELPLEDPAATPWAGAR
jgi:hypothetical protein